MPIVYRFQCKLQVRGG